MNKSAEFSPSFENSSRCQLELLLEPAAFHLLQPGTGGFRLLVGQGRNGPEFQSTDPYEEENAPNGGPVKELILFHFQDETNYDSLRPCRDLVESTKLWWPKPKKLWPLQPMSINSGPHKPSYSQPCAVPAWKKPPRFWASGERRFLVCRLSLADRSQASRYLAKLGEAAVTPCSPWPKRRSSSPTGGPRPKLAS